MIARRARNLPPSASDGLRGDVRDRHVARRERVVAQVGERDVDDDVVRGRVALVASTACGSKSTASTGAKPSLAAGDREHARPAADVEQAARLLPQQQLQAEPRRRVRAGAERAPGVDHDRGRVGVGLLPRRADPERADANRAVELPPALLPAGLDVGRRGAAERLPERSSPAASVYAASSSASSVSSSSNPSGKSSSMTRARLLGPRGAAP